MSDFDHVRIDQSDRLTRFSSAISTNQPIVNTSLTRLMGKVQLQSPASYLQAEMCIDEQIFFTDSDVDLLQVDLC